MFPNLRPPLFAFAGRWRGCGLWCFCWEHASSIVPVWLCQSVPSAWRKSSAGARKSLEWCWAASSGATASPKCSGATSATGRKQKSHCGPYAVLQSSFKWETRVPAGLEARRSSCWLPQPGAHWRPSPPSWPTSAPSPSSQWPFPASSWACCKVRLLAWWHSGEGGGTFRKWQIRRLTGFTPG